MDQKLDDLQQEFQWELLDFQVSLLALECLDLCQQQGFLPEQVPPAVLEAYRLTMDGFIQQHAEGLCFLAVRMAEVSTGGEWELYLKKKAGAAE